MRVNRKDLDQILKVLQNKTGRDLFFDFAGNPRRPRLCERLRNGGVDEISPRLPMGRLYSWMEAFETGLGYGIGSQFFFRT